MARNLAECLRWCIDAVASATQTDQDPDYERAKQIFAELLAQPQTNHPHPTP